MIKGRWTIPAIWNWVCAGEIADVISGGTPSTSDSSNFTKDGIPWLTPADLSNYKSTYIERGARDISEKGLKTSSARILPKGTVLFTSRAPIGYCAIAANKISTNQGFKSLVLSGNILPEFIRHYLLSAKAYAESLASGSTFKELSGKRVESLEIPLPPLNEQRRIVAKIEALKARSQKAKEALEAIPLLLDQFRQSVLAAAFRGDLTADWREKNPDVEPASVLLERIRAERRRHWEEAELERMKANGKTPTDDKWKKKYEEPSTLEMTDLPPLMNGWTYTFLEPLLSTRRTGLKTGPFGSLLKKHEHRADGIPVLGIENLGSTGFIQGNKIYISEAKARELAGYDAQEGDVLISRSGTVGEVCVVPSGLGDARISTNLIRVCLAENALLAEYFCLLFRGSSFILNQVSELCSGSTRDFLNQTILSSLIFPVSPLAEQQEIIQRIKTLFEFAKKIEDQIAELNYSFDWLNQAILAKAFRGELVPQDPNDEPASVLLERIQAERAKREAAAKTAKKSTGKITGRRSRKAKQQDSESIQLGLPGLE